MRSRMLIVAALAVALFGVTGTANAAQVDHPRNPAPAWFTPEFKALVDASGTQGVPMDEPSITDVCPGVAIHEGGVGTGTCIVVPFGCTANFVYYNGGGAQAPGTADGNLYLGTAGHCTEKVGEDVYAAVDTPGVGPAIKHIGTVSQRIEDYPDSGDFHDFAAIKIDNGLPVEPNSPVGGPQGIYDGCDPGQPLKYYGNGYEAAVAQGKPGGGLAIDWFDDSYGYGGTAFGGDSGSGVLHADGRAVGNLDASAILYPPWLPGETIGSRVTWILEFLGGGYSLVNADGSLSRDTTSPCGTPDGDGEDGGGGGGNKGGNGKGGGGKGGGGNGGGNGRA